MPTVGTGNRRCFDQRGVAGRQGRPAGHGFFADGGIGAKGLKPAPGVDRLHCEAGQVDHPIIPDRKLNERKRFDRMENADPVTGVSGDDFGE